VSQKQANRRIRLLLVLFLLAFGVTFGRAAWLQGVRAASLSKKASAQHREVRTIAAGRGTIFDRMGVQLAIGQEATTVFADPRQVTDAHVVATASSGALGVNANDLYAQLQDRSTAFLYVERKADPKAAAALQEKGLPGLGFYPEERRAYPQSSVASPVLGYAGVDNTGIAGLELEYDRYLRGRTGKQIVVKDPFGRAIDTISSTPEHEGSDVYLTIDHTIQANAESILRNTVRTWRAKSATAVVLDPRTGAILAMASAPGFDANVFGRTPPERTRNHAVTDVYEPGSTFKLVTVAGALADGVVTPNTKFTLPYSIRVADRVVHDAEERGTETMSVARILAQSSNVGAVTLARTKLGETRLKHWITQFGFGRRTGIDFPGESAGILPAEPWSGSTIGNVPIGQGIAVTPVQMAAAYAAIANGGVWHQPHLVERISGHKRPKVAKRRMVTPLIAAELKAMLTNVVREGTGTLAAIPGYRVAGKTGTAEKPDPRTGGYATGRYVASFVGMVPASEPRLIVLVAVDEPHGAIFGGVVAAPAFRDIAKFDLQYLEIPPDAPQTVASTG
jgi:cell division protein FtsI (penicillin-binding protein 3)